MGDGEGIIDDMTGAGGAGGFHSSVWTDISLTSGFCAYITTGSGSSYRSALTPTVSYDADLAGTGAKYDEAEVGGRLSDAAERRCLLEKCDALILSASSSESE